MSQYFLIKEQKYTDGAVEKTDISMIRGISFDNYDKALKEAQTYLLYPTDIIYVAEVVAKCFGDAKEMIKGDANVKT